MEKLKRILRHLINGQLQLKKAFSHSALAEIREAIAAVETLHSGEIAFCVEANLSPWNVFNGVTPRERALEIFTRYQLWDTEKNNAVLIYVLLADRDVEIVADRGLSAQLSQERWEAICQLLEEHFRDGNFRGGVLEAIHEVGTVIAEFYPPAQNINELPDNPIVL